MQIIYVYIYMMRQQEKRIPDIPDIPDIIKFKYLDFLTNKKDIYRSVKQNKSCTEDADHIVWNIKCY